MKIKKRYIALALAACLCFSACGNSKTAPETLENIVMDDSVEYDYSGFPGSWLGEDGSVMTVEAVRRTRFELCDAEDNLTASGEFQYVEKYDCVYAYNEHNGIAYRCRFEEADTLHLDGLGTFTKVSGDVPGENIGDLGDLGDLDEDQTLHDDGRGDPIPSSDIPLMLGGRLPFTNMASVYAESYDDGGYYYEDITEDGQITVIDGAKASTFDADEQELGAYLTDCALSLTEGVVSVSPVELENRVLVSCEENEEYSQNFSYPVYIIQYTTGENEYSRKWTIFAADTDSYTYLYGFCETADAAEGMDEIYQDIFAGLYLSDEEESE